MSGGAARTGGPPIALKETCRVVGGKVPLWPLHRARLAAGGCGEELLALVERRSFQAAAEWATVPTHRARLTVVVREDGTVSAEVSRRLSSLDVPRGLVAARIDVEVVPVLPPGPAKPADRSAYDAAHRRARALGAHQAVLVGSGGVAIDGSTSTIWIVENGVLVTPPSPPAVPGVGRAFVLERLREAGIHTRVETMSWDRFECAEEAFLTNAYGGAAPVRSRGNHMFEVVARMFSDVWSGAS